MKRMETTFNELISLLCSMDEVLSVGRSGGGPLPSSPAGGDIDVFLYCSAVPGLDKRRAVLEGMGDALGGVRIGAFAGGHWGTGDFTEIDGVETWLMYFTEQGAADEVDAVLAGRFPDRLDNYYYPTGRCAMFLGMEVLCDKSGFLAGMKQRLAEYPEAMAIQLSRHHLARLDDVEDLERAVARGDVLFYHFALELAIDHFLQALFAMNRTYFPSRKRSLEHMPRFAVMPENCGERLLDIVRLGGCPEGLNLSFQLWRGLADELRQLAVVR